jgi:hypothetical protein
MRSFKKTVTEKQLAANRANAQKSTGAKTAAGKEASSQNRRWHGLCGPFKVLACESQQAFEHLFDEFVACEQPANAVELELVRKMAEYSWLRQRATYFHESCFYVEDKEGPQTYGIRVNPELHKFIRYQAHYDRCYARAAAELLRRRKERQLQESRFESQKRAQAAEMRREKHEHRQEERHFWHTANAKLDFQRKEVALKAASAA